MDKKIQGSITADGQVIFGMSSTDIEDDTPTGPRPPAPAGIFEALLTTLDPYRQWECSFPIEVFTPAMQAAVADIANDLDMPPKMISGVILGWASALVLRTRAIWYKNNWREHGNLYMVIVAPSGVGKSPAVRCIFADIKRIEAGIKAEWKKAVIQYQIDMKAYKNSKDPAKTPPKRPPNIQYLLDDATLEAVAERLEDNPRGFCWEIDEMSGWFDELDRYNKNGSGSGKKKLYKMWATETLSVSRKSQDGIPNDQHFDGACLSVLGGIQTDVLPHLFTKIDHNQGLPNRFLYLPVAEDELSDSEIDEDNEGDVSPETNELIRRITRRGLNLEMDLDSKGNFAPAYIRLDDDARREFVRFRNIIKRTTKATAVFAFARKMQSQILRIALILHCLECLEQDTSTEYPISQKTMRDAIKVGTFFFWGLRTIWETLGYEDQQEPKEDSSRFPLEIKLRNFIDTNENACSRGLIAGEFFDLGLKKADFGKENDLRKFLREIQCPENKSNGYRFYPCEIIKKNPMFGIPSKPAAKVVAPKATPARRGMSMTAADVEDFVEATEAV